MVFSTFTKLISFRKDRPEIAHTNSKTQLAFLISRIFGPFPMVLILWLITALKSGIGFWKALIVYPLIFSLTILIPLLVTVYLFWSKKVPDIEWKNINDRKKYFLPLTLVGCFSLCVSTYYLTNTTIFHLSLLFSTMLLAMTAIWIMFNFKISGHVVMATITVYYFSLFFGVNYLWLIILIIPIIWARRTLKVHTLAELIAGFLLPTFFSAVALLLFGWPNVT